MTKPTTEPTVQELASALADIQAKLTRMIGSTTPAPETGKRRLARGTPSDGDGHMPPPKPLELPDRIVHELSGAWEGERSGERRPMTAEQIAKALREPPNVVNAALTKLEAAGRVTCLLKGGDVKSWTLRPGAGAGNAERRATIVGLLMEEPLGNGDLIRITGAKPKQIENDLVEIRRKEPVWWMNKGVGGHLNVYWIAPDRRTPPAELDGRLTPKYRPKK